MLSLSTLLAHHPADREAQRSICHLQDLEPLAGWKRIILIASSSQKLGEKAISSAYAGLRSSVTLLQPVQVLGY